MLCYLNLSFNLLARSSRPSRSAKSVLPTMSLMTLTLATPYKIESGWIQGVKEKLDASGYQ